MVNAGHESLTPLGQSQLFWLFQQVSEKHGHLKCLYPPNVGVCSKDIRFALI